MDDEYLDDTYNEPDISGYSDNFSDAPGVSGGGGPPPLDSDYFQHQTNLYTVDYASEFQLMLIERGFSRRFTNALYDITNGHFDKTHVLASLTDTEMSELYFDLSVSESLATADAILDRNNSYLPETLTIAKAMYMHFISRADGTKGPTERERQGRYTLYSEQRITNALDQSKDKGRGWMFNR